MSSNKSVWAPVSLAQHFIQHDRAVVNSQPLPRVVKDPYAQQMLARADSVALSRETLTALAEMAEQQIAERNQ